MSRSKKTLFYCVFFSPRVKAPPGTRFFLEKLAARFHAHRRLKSHKPSEKAHIYSFDHIPIRCDADGLPLNRGFHFEREKFFLLEKVTELTFVEIIERSEDELVALVERRMSRKE